MKQIIRALAIFKPDLPRLAASLLLLALGICAGLLKPWPVALLVDAVLLGKSLPGWLERELSGWDQRTLILLLASAALLFHVVQGLLAAASNYLSIAVGLRGLARIRSELFEALQRLSMRFYHQQNQGDLIYRASWDSYSFQTLFQQGLINFVTALLSLGLMTFLMWRLNGHLTLVALAAVPILLLVMVGCGRKMQARSLAAHQSDSRVTILLQQNIAAMPLIQSFTGEPEQLKQFQKSVQEALNRRASQHGWEVSYSLAIAVIFGLSTAAILWAGSSEALAGRITVGQLLIFLAYLAQFYDPLTQLSRVGMTVADATAGAQRVFELLDAREQVHEMARPLRLGSPLTADVDLPAGAIRARGNIDFHEVSFAYRPGVWVLKRISLEIKAGESIALMGPSGSGKTTLLQLIPRFYDPDQGEVRLETSDLKQLNLKDLRRQISMVFQEPLLLPGSIRENIAYGKPGASASEIEAAAKAAQAHEFILKLPNAYDTIVGEAAARLSVGEKQRINLARAFLKDAPILLMDEPTSALDAENEELVLAGLVELMKNRTTVLVTHRQRALQYVQRTVLLENGEIRSPKQAS